MFKDNAMDGSESIESSYNTLINTFVHQMYEIIVNPY